MSATLRRRPVMILAGGTGGHIFPGLAVARALRARGVPVVWLGARRRHGNAAGAAARHRASTRIAVSGLRGKGVAGAARRAVRLLRAVAAAGARVLRAAQPRAVLSFGGFAAGPGRPRRVAAAAVPLLVHEQNRAPGMTNRVLSRSSRAACCAASRTASPSAEETVGNPVRAEIAALPPPAQRFAGRDGALRLLVLGGSQGARALNAAVPQALAALAGACAFEVRHQCGEKLRRRSARAPTPRPASTRASSPSSPTWPRPTAGPTWWSAAPAR